MAMADTTTGMPAEVLAQMISVNVPRAWLLNANVKRHWRDRGKRAAWLRAAAQLEALAFRRRLAGGTPLQGKVRCEVLVAWPDRRRRDVHNVMPTVKPCIDGIVDARVLADDSDKHLIGPDLRVTDQLCDRDYACTLTFLFTEVPA
ncbi:hypothetical protein GCM10009616_36140 [Microlunatus lacustris]